MIANVENEHGSFNINKHQGISSQQVVQKIKKLMKFKKIGHAGTLDPIAEGVLPILCGKATRLFDFLLNTQKTYRVTIKFGIATDTMDRTGAVISENRQQTISKQDFQLICERFVGPIPQEPPMFSARRYQGKRLYKLARKGLVVPRQKKIVNIYSIDILSFEFPIATFRVCCDRGTYVRVLCDDIGREAGLGAHLHHLIREQLGPFTLENSLTISEFSEKYESNTLRQVFFSMNDIVGFLPAIVLSGKELERVSFGNAVNIDSEAISSGQILGQTDLLRILNKQNELKAVAKLGSTVLTNQKQKCLTNKAQPICVF